MYTIAIKAANAAVKSFQLAVLILTGIFIACSFLFTVLIGGELFLQVPEGTAASFMVKLLSLFGLENVDFTMII